MQALTLSVINYSYKTCHIMDNLLMGNFIVLPVILYMQQQI